MSASDGSRCIVRNGGCQPLGESRSFSQRGSSPFRFGVYKIGLPFSPPCSLAFFPIIISFVQPRRLFRFRYHIFWRHAVVLEKGIFSLSKELLEDLVDLIEKLTLEFQLKLVAWRLI
ncbi:hypothetical protein OPV22_007258 [Ensete ventricosum]|uniref:Uncharacterized protein n=1 Tax=Ensete ventricosum TaxID=4639 RepID=A0AAV8RN63_ENSVE|nr:hypothetical protein OPV22_007258 [Ensete ventricosum]